MAKKARKKTGKKASTPREKLFKEELFSTNALHLEGLRSADHYDASGDYIYPFEGKIYVNKDGYLIAEADCGESRVIANTKAQMKQLGNFILKCAGEKSE